MKNEEIKKELIDILLIIDDSKKEAKKMLKYLINKL